MCEKTLCRVTFINTSLKGKQLWYSEHASAVISLNDSCLSCGAVGSSSVMVELEADCRMSTFILKAINQYFLSVCVIVNEINYANVNTL